MNYEKLFEQLQLDEGVRFKAYLCSEGYWTVGIGRNLEAKGLTDKEQKAFWGEVYSKDQVIDILKRKSLSLGQVSTLFQSDVSDAEEACHKHIPHMSKHCDARQAVFINMAFQLGIYGLLKFKKALAAAATKDYESCAFEMGDSLWRQQTPERASRLIEQMSTGEWQ